MNKYYLSIQAPKFLVVDSNIITLYKVEHYQYLFLFVTFKLTLHINLL